MGHSPIRRRFQLRDSLFLIAAIAIGFAGSRPALRHFAGDQFLHLTSGYATRVFYGLLYGTPILISCSVAVLMLSMTRPRTPLRRVTRSPGFMANVGGVAGVICMLVSGLCETFVASIRQPDNSAMLWGKRYVVLMSYSLSTYVWCFVLGAILPSLLRRDLLPRPDWLDRLGWALGSIWLLLAILVWLQGFIY